MMRRVAAGLLVGMVCGGPWAVVPASAQAAPDSENGRFTFHRVDEGYLRLDTRTGQVSACARKPVGWACHPIPDERSALEGEIARLQADNGLMKKELLARNIPLPGSIKKDPPLVKLPEIELKVPSDSDMEKAFTFLEKVWRRLAETMSAIQRDYFGKI